MSDRNPYPQAPAPGAAPTASPQEGLTTDRQSRIDAAKRRGQTSVRYRQQGMAADRMFAQAPDVTAENEWMQHMGRMTQDRTQGLGIDRDVLRSAPDLVQRQVEGPEALSMPGKKGGLGGFMGRMVQRADDMATLEKISRVADQWYNGKLGADDARAQVAELRKTLSDGGWMEVDRQYQQLQGEMRQNAVETPGLLGGLGKNLLLGYQMAPVVFEAIIGDTVGLAAQQMPGLRMGALGVGALTLATVGGGAVAGGARGAMLAGRALYGAGRMTSLGKAAVGGAFTSGYLGEQSRLQRSLTYLEMKETPLVLEDGTEVEMPDGIARSVSAGVGAVTAGIDLAQVALGMSLAGPGASAAATGLRAATHRAVRRMVADGTFRNIGLRHALRWTGAATAETGLEVAQEIAAVTGGHVATELTRMTTGAVRNDGLTLLQEAVQRSKDTLRMAPAMALLAAAPSTVGYVGERGRRRAVKNTGVQLFEPIRGTKVAALDQLDVPDDAVEAADEPRARALANEAIVAATKERRLPAVQVRKGPDGRWIVQDAESQALVRLMQQGKLTQDVRIQDLDSAAAAAADDTDWVTEGQARKMQEFELAFEQVREALPSNVDAAEVRATVTTLSWRAAARDMSLADYMKEVNWRDPDTIDDGALPAAAGGRTRPEQDPAQAQAQGAATAADQQDPSATRPGDEQAAQEVEADLWTEWEGQYQQHQRVIGGADVSRREGVLHVMQQEGFVDEPFRDAGNVWTWGFGATEPADAERPSDITPQSAVRRFEADYREHEQIAEQRFTAPEWAAFSARQRAAIVSTTFNLGANVDKDYRAGALDAPGRNTNVTLANLMAGYAHGEVDEQTLVNEWVTFTKDTDGGYLPGLLNRRGRDIAMFFGRVPAGLQEAMQEEHDSELARLPEDERAQKQDQLAFPVMDDVTGADTAQADAEAAVAEAERVEREAAESADRLARAAQTARERGRVLGLAATGRAAAPAVTEPGAPTVPEPGAMLDQVEAQRVLDRDNELAVKIEAVVTREVPGIQAAADTLEQLGATELAEDLRAAAGEAAGILEEPAAAEPSDRPLPEVTEEMAAPEHRRGHQQADKIAALLRREIPKVEAAAAEVDVEDEAAQLHQIAGYMGGLLNEVEVAQREADLPAAPPAPALPAPAAPSGVPAPADVDRDNELAEKITAVVNTEVPQIETAIRLLDEVGAGPEAADLRAAAAGVTAALEARPAAPEPPARPLPGVEGEPAPAPDVTAYRRGVELAEKVRRVLEVEVPKIEAAAAQIEGPGAERVTEAAGIVAGALEQVQVAEREADLPPAPPVPAPAAPSAPAPADVEAEVRAADALAEKITAVVNTEVPQIEVAIRLLDEAGAGPEAADLRAAAAGVTAALEARPAAPETPARPGVEGEGVPAPDAAAYYRRGVELAEKVRRLLEVEVPKLEAAAALVELEGPRERIVEAAGIVSGALEQVQVAEREVDLPPAAPGLTTPPEPGIPAPEPADVEAEVRAAEQAATRAREERERAARVAAEARASRDRARRSAQEARRRQERPAAAEPAAEPVAPTAAEASERVRDVEERVKAERDEAVRVEAERREAEELAAEQLALQAEADQAVERANAEAEAARQAAEAAQAEAEAAAAEEAKPAPEGQPAPPTRTAEQKAAASAAVQSAFEEAAARQTALREAREQAVEAKRAAAEAKLEAERNARRTEEARATLEQAEKDSEAAHDLLVTAQGREGAKQARTPELAEIRAEVETTQETATRARVHQIEAEREYETRQEELWTMRAAQAKAEDAARAARTKADAARAALEEANSADLAAQPAAQRQLQTQALETQEQEAEQEADLADQEAQDWSVQARAAQQQVAEAEEQARAALQARRENEAAAQAARDKLIAQEDEDAEAVRPPAAPIDTSQLKPERMDVDPAVLGERGVQVGARSTRSMYDPVTLWEDLTGQMHVAGGAGRAYAAREIREQNPDEPAVMEADVLRASNGVTREQAEEFAAIGRQRNAERQLVGLAGWLRANPANAEWFQRMPSSGRARRAAVGLSNLSEDAYEMVRRDGMKFGAWSIGEIASHRPEMHRDLVEELKPGAGTVHASAYTRYRIAGQSQTEARTRADVVQETWESIFNVQESTARANRLLDAAAPLAAEGAPLAPIAEANHWRREDVLQAGMTLWLNAMPVEEFERLPAARLAGGLSEAARRGLLEPDRQHELADFFRKEVTPGDTAQIGMSEYYLVEPHRTIQRMTRGRAPVREYRENPSSQEAAQRLAIHYARKRKERVYVVPVEDFGKQVYVVQPESETEEDFGPSVDQVEYATPGGEVWSASIRPVSAQEQATEQPAEGITEPQDDPKAEGDADVDDAAVVDDGVPEPTQDVAPAPTITEEPAAEPVTEEAVAVAMTAVHRHTSVSAADVVIDPERFQFKRSDTRGRTGKLIAGEGNIEEWDDVAGGGVTLWEGRDGKLSVVDGHQRVNLAKDLEAIIGHPPITLDAYVLREEDGVTPEAARIWGARRNIAQETADAVDAASVLRVIEPEERAKWLKRFKNNAVMRQGMSLTSLSPRVFSAYQEHWTNADAPLEPGIAAAIADAMPEEASPNAPAIQMAALEAAIKRRPGVSRTGDKTATERREEKIGELSAGQAGRDEAALLPAQLEAVSVDVPEAQMAMFEDLIQQHALVERSKIRARVASSARLRKRVMSVSAQHSDVLEGVEGTTINVAGAKDEAQQQKVIEAILDAYANVTGSPIAGALNEMSKAVKTGETTIGKAAEQLTTVVVEFIRTQGSFDTPRDVRPVGEGVEPAEPVPGQEADQPAGDAGDVQPDERGGGPGPVEAREAGDEGGDSERGGAAAVTTELEEGGMVGRRNHIVVNGERVGVVERSSGTAGREGGYAFYPNDEAGDYAGMEDLQVLPPDLDEATRIAVATVEQRAQEGEPEPDPTMELFQDEGAPAALNDKLADERGEIAQDDTVSARLVLSDGRSVPTDGPDAGGQVLDTTGAAEVDPRTQTVAVAGGRIRNEQIDEILRVAAAARDRGMRGPQWTLQTVDRNGRRQDFRTNGALDQDTLRAHYREPLGFRGRTRFIDGRAPEITITRTGNFDTIMHELAHVWRRELSVDQEAIAAKWAGARERSGGGWDWSGEQGERAEERFAVAFTDWARHSYEPPDAVRSLFDRFKRWLQAIRQDVRQKVNPEMSKLFEDLLLGADQPGVVAFEQNRQAMGNRKMADFRDPSGRTMRIRRTPDGLYRVMGQQSTIGRTPQGREVRRPEWHTVNEYQDRDDAIREVSGVMDGDVMAPVGNAGMRHESLPVQHIARTPSGDPELTTLTEREALIREEAKKIAIGELYQRDEDEDEMPAPDAEQVMSEFARRNEEREAAAGARIPAAVRREDAFQRGRLAERRRFLRRDALRYLRGRIGEIQKDLSSIVDRSRTLPMAFRAPVREMAGVLDLNRRGQTTLKRAGVPANTDPLQAMEKIIAQQEGALNEAVGLTEEQVSVLSREQLEAAQGPVIDGAADMMRQLPDLPFAQLKLRDLEKMHNTIKNAVMLMRRVQEMKLQEERDLASANRGQMIAEVGRSGEEYKPKLGNLQWLWDATVGIGVKKPEILFANLGGGRNSRLYEYWRRLKRGRTAERRTLQEYHKELMDGLQAQGIEFANQYQMEDWLNSTVEVPVTQSMPAREWSRGDLMSLWMSWRDPYSRERLTAAGAGAVFWNPKTNTAIGEPVRLDEADVEQVLTVIAADARRWEPALRTAFGRMYKDMSHVHMQLHGYEPEPAGPLYYPVSAVPTGDEDPSSGGSMMHFAFEGRKPEQSGPGVFKGMLEERTGAIVPHQVIPLSIVVARAGNHAAAYSGMEGAMRDWRMVLSDGSLDRAIERHWGPKMQDVVRELLRNLAHEHKRIDDWIKMGDRIRQNVSVATLANPRIAMMQALSYPLYGMYVPNRYVMSAWIAARKPSTKRSLQQRHRQFDPDFAERSGQGFDPDARSTSGARLLPPVRSTMARRKERAQKAMMSMLRFVDLDTVTAGEEASVQYGLDVLDGTVPWDKRFGEVLGLSEAEARSIPETGDGKVQAAYEFARWVTEKTQPSFLTENLSHMQRHPIGKWFMIFTGYRNVAFNALMESAQDYQRDPTRTNLAALATASNTIVFGAMGAELLRWLEKQLQGRQTGNLVGSMAWAGATAIPGLTPFSGLFYAHAKMGGEGAFDVPLASAMNNLHKATNQFVIAMAAGDHERAAKQLERAAGEGMKMWPGVPYWHIRHYIGAPFVERD